MANRDELFMRQDASAATPEKETPAPLRIHKQPSPGPQSGSDPSQQWANYRVPASAYGAPTSPPPSGPLPYPDDPRRKQQAASSGQRGPGRRTTPQEANRRTSMASDGSGGSGRGRTRFEANDPSKPTAAYGYSPTSTTSAKLAERRGTPAKNVNTYPPDSPGGPEPPYKSPPPAADHGYHGDDEGDSGEGGTLFQINPQRPSQPPQPTQEELQQQYYPPPLGATPPSVPQPQNSGGLHIPNPVGVTRLSSTASTSTTKASRGSPPPPETPIDGGNPAHDLGGIEGRYAASGIPGQNTLNEMQAQSAAAAARRAQYASPQPQRGPTPQQPQQAAPGAGRWSPTERPGSAPHGPPIAFQGDGQEVHSRGIDVPTQARSRTQSTASTANQELEADMNRMNFHDEPPPAYEPPAAGTINSQYPNEKGRYPQSSSATPANAAAQAKPAAAVDPNVGQHPAFAVPQLGATPSPQPGAQQNGAPQGMAALNTQQANQQSTSPAPSGAGPASPPPLPEGWIAHLDNNSGQYYYIHLPTQSTQWEFPKGPNPLNLQETPLSPTGTFVGSIASPTVSNFAKPLQSPGFGPVPQSAHYDRQSMASMASIASPTAQGFTGPPPSAGIDMYKIAPANGVYFGPYLRYTNMDIERGLWLGSIMLITDAAAQPPTIHIHQSTDLSPNPRQLKANPIQSHQRWIFYRYDVDLRMEREGPAKWTYAVTSHLGCTRFEFLVAGQYENSWRFVAHSGNDFAINVSANERSKLGGIPLMWKDVLLKHQECGGFHAQIGLGGQIYADRLWKDINALKQWTAMSGKENRKNSAWNARLDDDVKHAYFHYYTSHFDQPAIREAFAQIPQICCLDDHDIFDGWGSYPEHMQQSNIFKNIGRIGIDMYLLFQHHTTHEILRNVNNDIDLFTITGTGWHFVKYLGPSVVLVAPDTRSERNTNQVIAGPTYQGIFPKIATLPPSVQHCIWLLPVPIIYPRLEAVEQVAHTVQTGKKFVTGGFNMAGKVVGGLANVVGAKGVVNSGFDGVKKAVGKSGLMQGVLSPFGEVEVLDELRDLWTHDSKVRHLHLTVFA